MIDRIKNRLNKRKVKLFLVFLLCSGLAWFVSNLGEQYTNDTIFDLKYDSAPDSLLLNSVSKKNIKVRLRASGFQFLLFSFKNKAVEVDLSELEKRGSKYYVSPASYKNQIENQLSKSITVVDMDMDTLFFNFQRLHKKKVPVLSKVTIELEQHYMMRNGLKITPDSIMVIGPEKEIDTLQGLPTQDFVLSQLTTGFSQEIKLDMPKNLKNTRFSAQKVNIAAEIFKFSEKIFMVPVDVINVPEGIVVRTFPEMVAVLCRGRLSNIKQLKQTDFIVNADYSNIKEGNENVMELKLSKKPDSLNIAQLREKKVEFILKRQ